MDFCVAKGDAFKDCIGEVDRNKQVKQFRCVNCHCTLHYKCLVMLNL